MGVANKTCPSREGCSLCKHISGNKIRTQRTRAVAKVAGSTEAAEAMEVAREEAARVVARAVASLAGKVVRG